MKSLKTTILGVACWLICFWICGENFRREAWSLHYWSQPFLAFAVGWGLIHARDHSCKD